MIYKISQREDRGKGIVPLASATPPFEDLLVCHAQEMPDVVEQSRECLRSDKYNTNST